MSSRRRNSSARRVRLVSGFAGERGSTGGAICLASDLTIDVQGSRFLHNAALDGVAYSHGGAIALVGSLEAMDNRTSRVATTNFDGNRAHGGPSAPGFGGGISVRQAALVLGESVGFYGNVAKGHGRDDPSGGGAVYVAEFPAALLAEEAAEFVRNVAEGATPNGGALFVTRSPKTVRLKGAKFDANMVRVLSGQGRGGAVSVDRGGDVHLEGCELHDNTAEMASFTARGASGGAICVGNKGTAMLAVTKMWSNQAGGGAQCLPLHHTDVTAHARLETRGGFILQTVSSTRPPASG